MATVAAFIPVALMMCYYTQPEKENEKRVKARTQAEASKQLDIVAFMAARFCDRETARQCFEAAGWNLQRAMAEYMPPVPDSPVSGRTLQSSHFGAAYSKAKPPKGALQLGAALIDLLKVYCTKHDIPYDEGEGEEFIEHLQAEAMENAHELRSEDELPVAVQRMWTSALQLRGKEFCFLLNDGMRDDRPEFAVPLVPIIASHARILYYVLQLSVTLPMAGEAGSRDQFVVRHDERRQPSCPPSEESMLSRRWIQR